MKDVKISVIIPVYNGEKYIDKCLKSVINQSYPKSMYEIIVVDNKSTDNSLEIANKYNVITLIEEKKGSYAARNKGIRNAKGKIIAFLDVDCIASSDWLEEIDEYFRQNLDIFIVSGKVEFRNKQKVNIWGEYDRHRFLKQEHISKSGSATTANLSVRRKLIQQVGFFDSNLISGGDGEWTKRVNKKGYKLHYNEKIKVFHPIRNNFKAVASKCFRVGFGKGQIYKKDSKYTRLLIPMHTISSIKVIPKSVFSDSDRSIANKTIILLQLFFVEVIMGFVSYIGTLLGFFGFSDKISKKIN